MAFLDMEIRVKHKRKVTYCIYCSIVILFKKNSLSFLKTYSFSNNSFIFFNFYFRKLSEGILNKTINYLYSSFQAYFYEKQIYKFHLNKFAAFYGDPARNLIDLKEQSVFKHNS